MRIAYIILCHTDPEHIRRLTKKITGGTDDEAFIHVDGKCDAAPFEQTLKDVPQAHFLCQRIPVYWGGYSAVEATVQLLRAALLWEGQPFDRFVFLQGLDYPIRTNREIHAFLEKKAETEFLLAQNISQCADPHETHKYSLYWFLDSKTKLWARIWHKANSILFLRSGRIPHWKKNYVRNQTGEKMDIYQGCAQFGVTRKLAEYLVRFHDENPGFNRYFRTMYAPDEAYFHTIVYNSPFAAHTPKGKAVASPHLTDFENLTYFEYPTDVTLFTEKKDWPKLRDSGFLFFRKASSQSKELLDFIDEQHRTQEKEEESTNPLPAADGKGHGQSSQTAQRQIRRASSDMPKSRNKGV